MLWIEQYGPLPINLWNVNNKRMPASSNGIFGSFEWLLISAAILYFTHFFYGFEPVICSIPAFVFEYSESTEKLTGELGILENTGEKDIWMVKSSV